MEENKTPDKKPTRKKTTQDKEVDMKKFTCVSCGAEKFDMNLYFYDKPSTKCLWCLKFPKKEKVVKKEEKDNG